MIINGDSTLLTKEMLLNAIEKIKNYKPKPYIDIVHPLEFQRAKENFEHTGNMFNNSWRSE